MRATGAPAEGASARHCVAGERNTACVAGERNSDGRDGWKAHLRSYDADIVLRVDDLVVDFPIGRSGLAVSAVAGISLDVLRGETLGIVGESGCGKTTTGGSMMQLPPPTSGRCGSKVATSHPPAGERCARPGRVMQMVFQDPLSSLNPRRKVRQHRCSSPCAICRSRGTRPSSAPSSTCALEKVGIDPATGRRHPPHQLSAVSASASRIARALVSTRRPSSVTNRCRRST